jgi:putative DNA primase/helicase
LLELLGGRPPLTPTCKTGSGRLHFYFRPPAGFEKRARDGIELRVGAHQCVLPPSEHPETGRAYEWVKGREPWTLPLVEVPPALLEYLAETLRNGTVGPLPEIIPIGAIDTTLASLAGSMRRRGASEEAIYAALVAELARCEQGHTHTEGDCRRIARSVARYEPAGPATQHDRPGGGAEPAPTAELADPAEPFVGRTHAEVLRLELPEERELIEGLIPVGVPGTIAGQPGV